MQVHDMELHDDDQPIGRVLSRREVLALLGGAGAALVVGTGFKNLRINQAATPTAIDTSVPSCIVKPAKTEGPYFVDDMLNRTDIRIEPTDGSIKEGELLQLKFQVSQIDGETCTPLQGAQVDIWHCDALGIYSDVNDQFGSTVGQTWLRGYQVTDELGTAAFTTIYPGWYPGRTVHIHFKIRTDPQANSGYEFTSQLFFDEAMSDAIYTQKPYSTKGQRNTLNATDGIFATDGEQLTLKVVKNEDEKVGGYTATFYIALDLSQPATATGNGGGPGGNRPPGLGGAGAPPPRSGSGG